MEPPTRKTNGINQKKISPNIDKISKSNDAKQRPYGHQRHSNPPQIQNSLQDPFTEPTFSNLDSATRDDKGSMNSPELDLLPNRKHENISSQVMQFENRENKNQLQLPPPPPSSSRTFPRNPMSPPPASSKNENPLSPPMPPPKSLNTDNAYNNSRRYSNKANNVNSSTGTNANPSNESPRPKIPLSRPRPFTIRRSASAPAGKNPFGEPPKSNDNNNSKKLSQKKHKSNSSLESLVLSSEVLAIPARKRSVSTHSGGGENVTFDSMLEQVAMEEEERSRRMESRRRKQRFGNRARLGTDTSEITMEGMDDASQTSTINVLDKEEKEDDGKPIAFAMERFLGSSIIVDKGGGDVEVGDAPDALKAVTPAGVILVNRADPRSESMITAQSMDRDSDKSSSSLLSDLEILMLSTDGGLTTGEDDGTLGKENEIEEDSFSDGSIFEDTIGLDNDKKKEMIKDSAELFYSGSSNSGQPTGSNTPNESFYYAEKIKGIPDYQMKRSEQTNRKQKPEDRRKAPNTSIPPMEDQPPVTRRIRPTMTGSSRKKKNNATAPPINVDGFEYDVNDHLRPTEKKKKNKDENGKARRTGPVANKQQAPQYYPQKPPYRNVNEEHRFLMRNEKLPLDKPASYVKMDPKQQQFKGAIKNPLNSYQSISIHESNSSAASASRSNRYIPHVVTMDKNHERMYDYERGTIMGPVNDTFVSRRHRRMDSLMDSVFSSVRSVSTEDVEADLRDSEKYSEGGFRGRGE